MATSKLTCYLETNSVPYSAQPHPPAFTAQEVAQAAHLPGRSVAKTVIVRVDGELIMFVLPAPERIDLESFKDFLGAEEIQLASESEFMDLFPDSQIGAMTPFDNRCGLRVFVTPSLAASEQISFRAATHCESVCIAYRDFERLVHPETWG
jgi:Ala-tRNA(Pro) deacylase